MGSAFNREMLILARESRGLTQAELAATLSYSQSEVSKIENGIRLPVEGEVLRIARALDYPPEFFTLTDPVQHFGSACVYHRKKQTTPEYTLRRLLAMVNVRRIQIKRLLRAVDLHAENKFHRLDLEDVNNDPEMAARIIRSSWRLPPGPIQNLTAAIEGAGGVVIRCDFGTEKVDAVSQWLPDLPPLFFVNANIPWDRLRFTLAHEIGHLVLHQIPTLNMEKEADKFAAEFLMPRASILPEFEIEPITLRRLAALKPRWRASMNALLKRAGDLAVITPRTKSYLWFQMGKAGYRKNEPLDIPPEHPTLLRQIVNLHTGELGYTDEEVCRLIVANPPDLDIYIQPTTNLRVLSKNRH